MGREICRVESIVVSEKAERDAKSEGRRAGTRGCRQEWPLLKKEILISLASCACFLCCACWTLNVASRCVRSSILYKALLHRTALCTDLASDQCNACKRRQLQGNQSICRV